ncbi:uncharacterized protein LOC119287664 isoform X3 [Triticum dicoccoides]|uniref:uncharacterized protein LOC119287664 isoform X3 n=1 Tax=Triticum dicoccoides TaxID=85692 RepID=UPI00188FC949|nr:uncharacterized protein LOC119287664 isoform X3 [Triticum dicoccoides]XP_037423147.1 uncharacterized protein LOC119287664 isoform X3 [Triticum dicoccoides]
MKAEKTAQCVSECSILCSRCKYVGLRSIRTKVPMTSVLACCMPQLLPPHYLQLVGVLANLMEPQHGSSIPPLSSQGNTHQYSSYGGGYQSGSTTKKIDIPNGSILAWFFTPTDSSLLRTQTT